MSLYRLAFKGEDGKTAEIELDNCASIAIPLLILRLKADPDSTGYGI
jgi:hypothetical protein